MTIHADLSALPPALHDEYAAAATNDRIGSVLVLDQPGMRVWHMRLTPGQRIPAHRHDRPYFWTVLGDGKGRTRYGDGRVAEVSYKAGDTRYYDLTPQTGFVHDLTNIGEQDLVFVTVEFSAAE